MKPVATAFAFVLGACGLDAIPAAGGSSGESGTVNDSGSSSDGEPQADLSFVLEFDAASETVTLRADDLVLLRLPRDAFQVGVTDQIDASLSYNPMHALAVTWLEPESIAVLDGGALTLRLTYPQQLRATVRFDEDAPGRFGASWLPDAGGPVIAAYRLRARIDPSEGLYGLGEWFDHPNNRGLVRPMQIESDLSFEHATNEAHVPVPFLTGTRGWGLFVQDPHPGRFDCATVEDDLVVAEFGVGPDGPDGLRFHLLAAAHPLDVTAHYYATTGKPAVPSRWALGPWIWRNENRDQAQVIADANALRDLDLPASALWVDRPYATGVNTFDFEPGKFPAPQVMIDELHALGLRFGLWHTPYASDDAEPATALHDAAVAMGYYPPAVGPILHGWGPPVDLTNPDAYDWWQSWIDRYAAMGVEGYKLDYAEDVVAGLGPARLAWTFADGSTDRTMQSEYQRLYHRVYAETLPADGGFILARAGTYGDQVYSSVIWPGDLDANFSPFAELVDGERRSGGLPAAVVAGMSLGPSGYPLFASDTGGYRHSPPNKETFTRWFQHTALTPVMQIGTSSNDVAWEPTKENGFDAAMLDLYREFTRLHLRLFPYLWTHVLRVQQDGRPIVRALGLAYPELGEHPAFDYMLGDDLLVAPVVVEGATTRELVVPAGRWRDWFSDEELVGPGHAVVEAPLSKLPLYLREGGLVPMLRPTIDSLSPTTQPDRVDSYATDAGVLYVRTFPGLPSSLTLYDNTTLAQGKEGGAWAFRVQAGDEFTRGVVVEAIGFGPEPGSVVLDNVAVAQGEVSETGGPAWSWDAAQGGTLRARIVAGASVLVTRE